MHTARKSAFSTLPLRVEGHITGATLLLSDRPTVSRLSRFYGKVFPFQRCGDASPTRHIKLLDEQELRKLGGMNRHQAGSGGQEERKCIWVPHLAHRLASAQKMNVELWNFERDVVSSLSSTYMDPRGTDVYNSRAEGLTGGVTSFPFVHVEVEKDQMLFQDSWRAPFQQNPKHCGAVTWCELLCEDAKSIRPTVNGLVEQNYWIPARPVDVTRAVADGETNNKNGEREGKNGEGEAGAGSSSGSSSSSSGGGLLSRFLSSFSPFGNSSSNKKRRYVGTSPEGIPIPAPEEEGDEHVVILNGTGELTNRHKVCALRTQTSLIRDILLSSSSSKSASTSTYHRDRDNGERTEDTTRVVKAVENGGSIVYFCCANQKLLEERVAVIRAVGGAALYLPSHTRSTAPDGVYGRRALCVDPAGTLFGMLVRSEQWDERSAALQTCDNILSDPPLDWFTTSSSR